MTKRMPAEWETQSMIQLTLPTPHSDWESNYEEIMQCYLEIITVIASFEKILLLCNQIDKAKNLLPKAIHHQIIWKEIPTNDTWCRDYGGITVFENATKRLLDFTFNGWGNKFTSALDNQTTKKISQDNILNNYSYKKIDFVLEGGSIDSNGAGILLTTNQCLLNSNRNPNYSKEEISHLLEEELGVRKILWLNSGYLQGDDTDAHIDTIARFLSGNSIAYAQCKDKTNPNYDRLKQMEKELRGFTDQNGKPFHLFPLPLPDTLLSKKDEHLPATYLNFLFINNALLIPQYNQEKDKAVLQFFIDLFPEKEIIGINCVPLIQQGGAIHCASMQYY